MKKMVHALCMSLALVAAAAGAPVAKEIGVPVGALVGDTIRFGLRAGTTNPGPRITLSWGDKNDLQIKVGTQASRVKIKGAKDAEAKEVELSDHFVRFAPYAPGWPRLDYYIRPNIARYKDAQQIELVEKWDTLPRASEAEIPLEFRKSATGWELWLDGCYGGSYARQTPLKSIQLQLPEGSAASEPVFGKTAAGLYLPLDMSHIVPPSSTSRTAIVWTAGGPPFNGVPIGLLETGGSADVGRVRECRGLEGLEEDADFSRSPWDGMPEHLHYSVPLAQYARAWVLCAVDDDPEKDPILTVRLTRFCRGGRGEAIADTSITLPRAGEKPGAGITRVGAVGGKDGSSLWLCEVPLKTGEIQDLLWGDRNGALPLQGEYLDFEFLGKLDVRYSGVDRSHKPDPKSVSAVRVYGVTLEKSPVEMEARKTQVGNVFHNDEKPEMQVALRPLAAAACRLSWEIRDIDGRVRERGSEKRRFDAAGTGRVVNVSLAMKEPGWYGLDFVLADLEGREWVRHPASFVLLGPDTRQAGYESPYMSWWFGFGHLGTRDPAVGGPLLYKMGVRRTTFFWHDKDLDEAKLAPWKLTLAAIPWMGRPYRSNDWAQGARQQEAEVRVLREKFPHCTNALLFHEGYPTFIVPELRDAEPTPEEAALNDWDRRILKLADAVSKVYREKFPEIKIQMGNTTYSAGLIALLLRNGFARFDSLGLETVGLTRPPEASVMREAWLERETARKFGVEAPVTGCHEFTVRDVRPLGPLKQAEWAMRDALIAHGLRFADVPLPGQCDPGDAYYATVWGSGAVCQRYPLLYPRPVYAAAATLTKVLDRAVLRRQVPTGSHSVFALEFARGEETVYALWVPRGEAEVALEFDADAGLTLIDLYGRSREVKTRKRKLDVKVGTAAVYLVGRAPNVRLTVGKRDYPENRQPANLQMASRMDDLKQWELRLGRDYRVHDPESKDWPLLTDGQFELRPVQDADKGPCLELELIPRGKLPDLMHEYVSLQLKNPPVLSGEPNTVGVWVKGNSSGGRILFEFQDAQGERWLSNGHWLDWPGHLSLNFDGWCFLSFPITSRSKVKSLTPGGESGQWVSSDDGVIQYPIRLTGLVAELPRKAINLNEMEPVKPVIRLANLGVWE